MYRVTQDILQVFQNENLNVFSKDSETFSYVYLYYELDKGGTCQIRFISTDDNNDFAVRVFRLICVEPSQRDRIIILLNELNNKYRYAKFCCDSECRINVEYDYPSVGNNPAESAKEILYRFVNIINEAYPYIMKCVWGTDANLE